MDRLTDELAPALAAEEAGDPFTIAGETFTSRLVLGTGGLPSMDSLERVVRASGTQLVTVALRRVEAVAGNSMMQVLDRVGVRLLPNTAGCMTAREAVRTAELGRLSSDHEVHQPLSRADTFAHPQHPRSKVPRGGHPRERAARVGDRLGG